MLDRSRFGILFPAFLALLLFLTALAAAFSWRGALVGLLAAGAGFALERWRTTSAPAEAPAEARPEAVPQANLETEATEATRSLHRVAEVLVPLWAGQTANARQQTEEAITALTARFAGMQAKLRSVLNTNGFHGIQSTRETIAKGQEALLEGIQQLECAHEMREAFLRKIENMVGFAQDLRQMSEEVAAIASRTNMLALNAAIEAAHAREMGKGFAVVAEEVRKLSDRSGDTGNLITQRIERVIQTLEETQEGWRVYVESVNVLVANMSDSVHHVIAMFEANTQALTKKAQQAERVNAQIQGELSETLLHLQFQDRVSQILQNTVGDMEKFSAWLKQNPSLPEVDRWLGELEQTYTTHEQRAIHRGEAVDSPEATEITFF